MQLQQHHLQHHQHVLRRAAPHPARVHTPKRIRSSRPATSNSNGSPEPPCQHDHSHSSSAAQHASHAQQQPDCGAPTAAAPPFPPKQQQQKQRKQLDVNRAVRLLKLTASRSDNTSTSKLPSWMMRTRDDEQQDEEGWDADNNQSTTNGNSSSNSASTSSSSSRLNPLGVATSLDSLADAAAASSNTGDFSAADQTASSSRWRGDDSTSSSSSISSSRRRAGGGGRSDRMYSASDPIRRPKSRAGESGRPEWLLLPWQESGDTNKEAERKFRRAVFSFERWAAHRSTWRYLRHFRGIFSSRTLQGLLPAVAFFTGMAALAGVYNTYCVVEGLPAFTLPKTALDITAFAVSLLLVFRTDSSYARYEEALGTWNEVRSLSKDLARQSCYWVNETARKDMLIRWSEAFSRALLVHCREDGCLESELEGVLEPHEVAAVAAVGPGGAPSFVLQIISELVEQCGVSEIKEDKMFSTLRALGDTVAVCDKLLRYPLPLAWSRHTSRFMFLWLSALPWSMWADSHWAVVPITGTISYLLLGIDEIGVQIEEPLGILPLEDICNDIQGEVDAMIDRQDIVTDLLVAGGVDCEPRSACGACGRPIPAEAAAAAPASAGNGVVAQ